MFGIAFRYRVTCNYGNNMNLSFPVFNAAKGTRPNEAFINKHDARPDLKWNKTRNKLPRTSQRMRIQDKKRRNSYKIRLRVLPTPTGKRVILFNMYATPSKPISNTLQSRFKCLCGTTAVSILLFFSFSIDRAQVHTLCHLHLYVCIASLFHFMFDRRQGLGSMASAFPQLTAYRTQRIAIHRVNMFRFVNWRFFFLPKKMPTTTTFVCTLQATRPQCIVNYMYNGRPYTLNGNANVHCIALHQAKWNECKLIQSTTRKK